VTSDIDILPIVIYETDLTALNIASPEDGEILELVYI
jgi:hypothetical protein